MPTLVDYEENPRNTVLNRFFDILKNKCVTIYDDLVVMRNMWMPKQ